MMLRWPHATNHAVDNCAPFAIGPESTYKSGNVVQTNGATVVSRVLQEVPELPEYDIDFRSLLEP